MEKEYIEKSAEETAERIANIAYAGGGHIGQDDLEEAFIFGSNWRINSVWHYDKSAPMLNKPFLFICHNRAIALQLQNKDDWELLVKDRIYVKWAYIEDLIPNTEN